MEARAAKSGRFSPHYLGGSLSTRNRQEILRKKSAKRGSNEVERRIEGMYYLYLILETREERSQETNRYRIARVNGNVIKNPKTLTLWGKTEEKFRGRISLT